MSDKPRQSSVHELSEDTLGFGLLELRTARDVVTRPRDVLEAWMSQGPSGGGLYARPLRLYLALNAILMVMLFLRGGAGFLLADMPPDLMAGLIEKSGKSAEAFAADADNWMSLVMVPVLSAFYALAAAPLLRAWDPDDLGWRRGFRAAFAWLCAWTVPIMPLAWWGFGRGLLQSVIAIVIFTLGIVAFVRMGRGRWFKSTGVGIVKGLGMSIAVQISAAIGGAVVLAIGMLGASLTN